jgi:ATP-dependent Lon protease
MAATIDVNDVAKDNRLVRIYDPEQVKALRAELDTRYTKEARVRMERLCAKMLEQTGSRKLVAVPEGVEKILDDLRENFPNFSEVIELIRDQLALQTMGNQAVSFLPLLLTGEPGVGKTFFAEQIAKSLGLEYMRIAMESAQNGAALSGSSEFWTNTQTGQLFDTLVGGKSANPLIVVDELDKVSVKDYDPRAALYQLLEKHTARTFRDQSVSAVALDTSHVLWVATANDLASIPPPLLSRLQVVEVNAPKLAEAKQIVRHVYRSIRVEEKWGAQFDEQLDVSIIDKLSAIPPRGMKAALLRACGRAASAKRRQITVNDIVLPTHIGHSRSIGFHP